jgi:DNA-binding transcriptional regulator LsrR (DeoR family)
MRLGDKLSAQRFPLPLPLITETVEDREMLQAQRFFRVLGQLRELARASFFGIGELEWGAPMHADGFLTDSDVAELVTAGAVGEMSGWPLDAGGAPIDTPLTRRITSLPLESPPRRTTVILAAGPRKLPAIRAVLAGRLITGLVTDEATASALLQGPGGL